MCRFGASRNGYEFSLLVGNLGSLTPAPVFACPLFSGSESIVLWEHGAIDLTGQRFYLLGGANRDRSWSRPLKGGSARTVRRRQV